MQYSHLLKSIEFRYSLDKLWEFFSMLQKPTAVYTEESISIYTFLQPVFCLIVLYIKWSSDNVEK